MDTTGKALLVILSDQALAHDIERPKVEDHLHIAQRNSPELARRMRAAIRAQRDLDDYVRSLVGTPTSK